MALQSCNYSINISRSASGKEIRKYSLYISTDGEFKECEDIQNLDLDDLRLLEREISRSIHLEQMMNNDNH